MADQPVARWKRWQWAVVLVVLLAFLGGAWWLWQRVYSQLSADEQFRLSDTTLLVTPQPPWIDAATNVKADVLRDATLHQITLWDDQAVLRVARAFELHPWVRRVVRASKQPPGVIHVELEYRRPIALVEVLFNDVLSYEPVDADGVILPEDLFHRRPELVDDYLKITVDYALPTVPVGAVWNDERVTGAARLAALLENHWKAWALSRIAVSADLAVDRHPVFELRTRGLSRIRWGHAPGQEPKGEPPADRKLAWIAGYVREHGPLDRPNQPAVVLDVRSDTGLQIVPAGEPQPNPE
ncbi:MAG: hypothetical protein KatS3mg110_4299 [Pirellulaceae bacterium]|nr:MAG: hypothetical protein KatS3mg110_4299 [Pirellulaceae bacterium]